MSAGPITQARTASTVSPMLRPRLGMVVIPSLHPEQCAYWTITTISPDRLIVTLEATTPCTPGRIRRHVRTLKEAH